MSIRISIIIPTYNEEKHIGPTIRLMKDRAVCKENLQIIVVDGGSKDNTVAEAQQYEINGAPRLQGVYALIVLLYKAGLAQSQLHALYKKWVQ